jgi:predicted secreted protein
MSTVKGRLMLLYHYDDGDKSQTLIGATQDLSVNFDNEIDDITTNESGGFKEGISTLTGFSVDFSGLYNPDTTGNFEDLFTLLKGKNIYPVHIDLGNGNYVFGNVIVRSIKMNGKTKGVITFSGSFEGTGEPTLVYNNINY